jgi:hypothetical protein
MKKIIIVIVSFLTIFSHYSHSCDTDVLNKFFDYWNSEKVVSVKARIHAMLKSHKNDYNNSAAEGNILNSLESKVLSHAANNDDNLADLDLDNMIVHEIKEQTGIDIPKSSSKITQALSAQSFDFVGYLKKNNDEILTFLTSSGYNVKLRFQNLKLGKDVQDFKSLVSKIDNGYVQDAKGYNGLKKIGDCIEIKNSSIDARIFGYTDKDGVHVFEKMGSHDEASRYFSDHKCKS